MQQNRPQSDQKKSRENFVDWIAAAGAPVISALVFGWQVTLVALSLAFVAAVVSTPAVRDEA
jgi:hypothetical protein